MADPIDDYIAAFAPGTQALLQAVRQVARQAAPEAVERISYRMPALFQRGPVVYYAAFNRHIGLYPPVADTALRDKLARWAGPKGNLQFPLHEPLPLELIAEVVRTRLAENLRAAVTRGRAHGGGRQP